MELLNLLAHFDPFEHLEALARMPVAQLGLTYWFPAFALFIFLAARRASRP